MTLCPRHDKRLGRRLTCQGKDRQAGISSYRRSVREEAKAGRGWLEDVRLSVVLAGQGQADRGSVGNRPL
jgi:hypothetical protein